MPTLTIIQKKSRLMPALPHKLVVNNQVVGIMKGAETNVELPAGQYNIMIQSMLPFFSASMDVTVHSGVRNVLTFSDREKIWDALLVVDMVLWVAELFFELPSPWDVVYQVFTNGYLVVWLVYEWVIRKRYFRMNFGTYKLA
ncbi:MAG: hypothetical protein IKQ94_12815 [Bacteroidales bacterium]|nr:hypothetical protein [Bacteroidales bacterium]